MADLTHQRSDPGPEVDTVGIYVKKHDGRCREFFIRMRFDFDKFISDGSGPATGGHSDFQIMFPGGQCFPLVLQQISGSATWDVMSF